MKIDERKDFGTRTCPSCACDVAANTNRCPVCGYDFPAFTPGKKGMRVGGAIVMLVILGLLLFLGLLN